MPDQIDLKVEHYFPEGLYVRRMVLPARHRATSHKHNFNHISFLTRGRVVVEVDGKETVMDGPGAILIKADAVHAITALTDATWYCIHESTVTDPELIDHTLIKES